VTIARAIANNPSILLLDEPTGDLDTRSTDIVMKILLDLNIEKKITMIMVTHDVALKTYSNRVVKMTDGKISKLIDIDP
jgi:putative ABC transport system ATP-binding protein